VPAKKKAPAAVAQSSVPAGTPLRGLNFFKDKSDPVAMEDSEYPDWLWTIVKDQQRSAAGAGGVASGTFIS
jgi:large subunit ribosomal protein L54